MKDLKCLANLLELDPESLQAEFLDLRPAAEWHFANGSRTSEDAWRSAHMKNRTKPSPRKTLEAALIRLFSWQINTCGVERAFAKGLQAARKRGDVSEPRLDDEVQLLSLNKSSKGKPAALPKHSDLIESARAVWTQHYGPPRSREKVAEELKGHRAFLVSFVVFPPLLSQAPAGRKRARPDDVGNDDKIASEAAFMRKRRREVDAAAGSVGLSEAVTPVAGVVGVGGWGEGHEKETKFLETKLLGRLMKAIAEGAVPWDSVSPTMQGAFLQWQQHDQELCKEALKSRRLSFTRPSFPNVSGLRVWWPEAVQRAVGEHELRRGSRALGLLTEESKYQAEVHVWAQVAEPESEEDKLLAGLHGKLVCDASCFLSSGKKGSFLIFKAATSIARAVFITPRFARDSAEVAQNIMHYCKPFRGTSSWVFQRGLDDFLKVKRKAVSNKRPTAVIVFGTEADKEQEGLSDIKLFLTIHDLAQLSFVDPIRSANGLDGRRGS